MKYAAVFFWLNVCKKVIILMKYRVTNLYVSAFRQKLVGKIHIFIDRLIGDRREHPKIKTRKKMVKGLGKYSEN